MTDSVATNLYIGEDIIILRQCDEAAKHALADNLLHSWFWEEVVIGISDITVKFDPNIISAAKAESVLMHAYENVSYASKNGENSILEIKAMFDPEYAPDADIVAQELGIDADALHDWLCARKYKVTMMGFQPGFPYLQDSQPDGLPTISRLSTPRQRVAAGSIGILGDQACIYAQDGPGGWPIVGRIQPKLFNPDNTEKPFLLSTGQYIRFYNASD